MFANFKQSLSNAWCNMGLCSSKRESKYNEELEQTEYKCSKCGREFVVRDIDVLAHTYGRINGHIL